MNKAYKRKLLEDLKDPQVALAYLNKTLKDKDPRVFLSALKDLIDARGENVTEIAKKANLNRENLYRMLSKKGNPKLTSIKAVLKALNLRFCIQYNNAK